MPYVAKERIHLNDRDEPCDENDPNVASLLVRAGGHLRDALVERLGLARDKRLQKIPDGTPEAEAEAEAAAEPAVKPAKAAKAG